MSDQPPPYPGNSNVGHPMPQAYSQTQAAYPPTQAGYPQPGYPQTQAGFSQLQTGYPQPQQGYPQPHGYHQPQGGYNQSVQANRSYQSDQSVGWAYDAGGQPHAAESRTVIMRQQPVSAEQLQRQRRAEREGAESDAACACCMELCKCLCCIAICEACFDGD